MGTYNSKILFNNIYDVDYVNYVNYIDYVHYVSYLNYVDYVVYTEERSINHTTFLGINNINSIVKIANILEIHRKQKFKIKMPKTAKVKNVDIPRTRHSIFYDFSIIIILWFYNFLDLYFYKLSIFII